MFWKWRRMARHLQKNGERAPATVVAIAKSGHEVSSNSGEIGPGDLLRDAVPDELTGDELVPESDNYIVRKTRLKITPAGGDEFEVEEDMRYGDWGREVPKVGDTFDVIYDPDDHSKVLVAPPTDEEEAIRTANALSQADIGITIGGGGKKPRPVTKEELDERVESMDESMDQAQSMLEQAQQFMSGQDKPGSKKPKKE